MVEEAENSVSSMRKHADFKPRETRSPAGPAESAQTDLLTRMSHEMRTPLSAILGYAQLMGSGAHSPTAAQKLSLDLILQAGWYLEKLINTTRDLALLESGALPLSPRRLSLAAIMLDCQGMIDSQARVRSVRVIFPVFRVPCFVFADGERVQQVLGNVLSAAIERCAVGGTVVVDYTIANAEWIRLTIGDGVAQQPMASQQAIALQDLGICVLLAARLVELMGGAIGTDNPGDAATAFYFTLRRADVPAAASGTVTDFHNTFTVADGSAANGIPE